MTYLLYPVCTSIFTFRSCFVVLGACWTIDGASLEILVDAVSERRKPQITFRHEVTKSMSHRPHSLSVSLTLSVSVSFCRVTQKYAL